MSGVSLDRQSASLCLDRAESPDEDKMRTLRIARFDPQCRAAEMPCAKPPAMSLSRNPSFVEDVRADRALANLALRKLSGIEPMCHTVLQNSQEQTCAHDYKTLREHMGIQKSRLSEMIERADANTVDAAKILLAHQDSLENLNDKSVIAGFINNIGNQISQIKSNHSIGRNFAHELLDIAQCQIRLICLVSPNAKIRQTASSLHALFLAQCDGATNSSFKQYQEKLQNVLTKIEQDREAPDLTGLEKHQFRLLLEDVAHQFGWKDEVLNKIEIDGASVDLVADVHGINHPEDLELLIDAAQTVAMHGLRIAPDRLQNILYNINRHNVEEILDIQNVTHPKDRQEVADLLDMRTG